MKYLFPFLFIFIIDIYFYKATSSINNYFNYKYSYSIFYWLISIFIYTIFFIITSRINLQNFEILNKSLITNLISILFIYFITKMVSIIPLIIDDFIRVLKIFYNSTNITTNKFSYSRLEFLRNSSIFIASILFGTLSYGMIKGRYNFKKYYQDIKIKGWSNKFNNYKIIQISDLHLGSYNSKKNLEKIVEVINKENADIVVFTGDLVNNYADEALPYIDILKKIKSKDGKFSILGNHDYGEYAIKKSNKKKWLDNFNKIKYIHEKMGFKLLLNESYEIKKINFSFNIVGVENWGKGRFSKYGDLDKATSKIKNDKINILLSHDPSHWREKVINYKKNIQLQLSGHTHGMQFGVEIPKIKWSPVQWRYKEWAGLYKTNNKQIYVNRGIGHLGYAGRVGINPDISILNIKS